MAGEVALEEADGVAAGFAFGEAAGDVVLGGGVVQSPVEDDGVEGAVELAVTAAAEPMSGSLTAGGGDRGDAGEPREGCFGAKPAWV